MRRGSFSSSLPLSAFALLLVMVGGGGPSQSLGGFGEASTPLRQDRQEAGPDLPEDCPLAHAFAARGFARDGKRLGVLRGGLLIPELVRCGTIRAGRFEVTRAQWQCLFPDFEVEPAEADHPITGIGAADAERYVQRLAERTGEPFRLLTVAEHEMLPRGREENTLDWWAGGELPAGLVPVLRARAAEIGGRGSMPPLLEPVGSRAPGLLRAGSEVARVYDAGGNAAEWVRAPDGSVVLRGGCAFAPAAGDPTAVPHAYAGVRVALGG